MAFFSFYDRETFLLRKGNCLIRTYVRTCAAGLMSQTTCAVEREFVLSRLRFRITAPAAMQRTAFEKQNSSYAWTIMYTVFLNIENMSCDKSVLHDFLLREDFPVQKVLPVY